MSLSKWITFSISLLWSSSAWVCSSFIIEKNNKAVMGKSYDWHMGHGLLTVNKRNMQKTSLVLSPFDSPAEWTSKYGSVTFNQYAVEFPNGGLNEAGLAVEILWLNQAKFPSQDARETVNESQWIQYQLDNYASTDEVIANVDTVRISRVYGNVHYLVCDKTRHCAVIEWVNGIVVVSDDSMAITNNTHADSKAYRSQFDGFGGAKGLPTGMGSLDRFVRVSSFSKNVQKTRLSARDTAWAALKSVRDKASSGGYGSLWNIVYDFDDMDIEFRHSDVGRRYKLKMKSLDFSCKMPMLTYDLEAETRGNSINRKLKKYKDSHNAAIIQKSIGSISGSLPPGAQKIIEDLPKSYRCTE